MASTAPTRVCDAPRPGLRTRTAWSVSATSWVRITWAPPSTAAVVAASEPGSRRAGSASPVDGADERLARHADADGTAERRAARSSPASTAVPLVPAACQPARKKPMPGSTTMASDGIPAARASSRLSREQRSRRHRSRGRTGVAVSDARRTAERSEAISDEAGPRLGHHAAPAPGRRSGPLTSLMMRAPASRAARGRQAAARVGRDRDVELPGQERDRRAEAIGFLGLGDPRSSR